jgi:hypothetical protein
MQWVVLAAQKNPSFLDQAWKVFVPLALVVAFVAAIPVLTDWWRRWRRPGVEERAMEAAADALEAEAAERHAVEWKRDAQQWDELRQTLRRQVEEEVPREARRVFLKAREDSLVRQIHGDVAEFERVRRDLADISDHPPTELDERLRGVIEREIRPAYSEKRGVERTTVALLVLLVALTFTPVSPRTIVDGFFNVTRSSRDYLTQGVVFTWLLGTAIASLLAAVSLRPLVRRRWTTPPRRLIWIAVGSAVSGVAMFAGALLARAHSINLESAATSSLIVGDARFSDSDNWQFYADWLFILGALAMALGVGYLIALVSLVWRRRSILLRSGRLGEMSNRDRLRVLLKGRS